MTKYYSVNPVACSRGKTFDAEVAFSIQHGLDAPVTVQKVVSTGHSTRLSAMSVATDHVERIQQLIESGAMAHLRKFPDAKE